MGRKIITTAGMKRKPTTSNATVAVYEVPVASPFGSNMTTSQVVRLLRGGTEQPT
jgi:hypothetical protein